MATMTLNFNVDLDKVKPSSALKLMKVKPLWSEAIQRRLSIDEQLDVLDVADAIAQKNRERDHVAPIGINGALELMEAIGLLVVSHRNAAARSVVEMAKENGVK